MLTAEEYWIPSLRITAALAQKGGDIWLCRLDHSGSNGQHSMHIADPPYWWIKLPMNNAPCSEADIRLAKQMHESLASFVRGQLFDSMPAGTQWPPTRIARGEHFAGALLLGFRPIPGKRNGSLGNSAGSPVHPP